jgi:hypothetical protein
VPHLRSSVTNAGNARLANARGLGGRIPGLFRTERQTRPRGDRYQRQAPRRRHRVPRATPRSRGGTCSRCDSWEAAARTRPADTPRDSVEHPPTRLFCGAAMWTYLTQPFTFALSGFQTTELEPWNEASESWRRLHVVWPSYLATHSTDQTLDVNHDRLLARHDYEVEISGGSVDRGSLGADAYDADGRSRPAVVSPAGSWSSTAPNASSAARCAAVTPVRPAMSVRS